MLTFKIKKSFRQKKILNKRNILNNKSLSFFENKLFHKPKCNIEKYFGQPKILNKEKFKKYKLKNKSSIKKQLFKDNLNDNFLIDKAENAKLDSYWDDYNYKNSNSEEDLDDSDEELEEDFGLEEYNYKNYENYDLEGSEEDFGLEEYNYKNSNSEKDLDDSEEALWWENSEELEEDLENAIFKKRKNKFDEKIFSKKVVDEWLKKFLIYGETKDLLKNCKQALYNDHIKFIVAYRDIIAYINKRRKLIRFRFRKKTKTKTKMKLTRYTFWFKYFNKYYWKKFFYYSVPLEFAPFKILGNCNYLNNEDLKYVMNRRKKFIFFHSRFKILNQIKIQENCKFTEKIKKFKKKNLRIKRIKKKYN